MARAPRILQTLLPTDETASTMHGDTESAAALRVFDLKALRDSDKPTTQRGGGLRDPI